MATAQTFSAHPSRRPRFRPARGLYASLVSELFQLRVRVPTFFPFWAGFNGVRPDPYEITFVEGRMPSDVISHTSREFGGASEMMWSMALVFFYEQQVRAVREKFGATKKDREEKWPEIARFAWALRNAAAHHHGALNISDELRRLCWHHLQYTKADNGKKVIHRDVMRPADILIFLVEYSDELDRLGVALLQ